jgi:PDZ domain-containing secreted protein
LFVFYFELNLVNEQWIILLLLSILFVIFIYLFQKRKRNSNSIVNNEGLNKDEYLDQMIRIREQQQKAYEEQALRHAEQKKAVCYLFFYLLFFILFK